MAMIDRFAQIADEYETLEHQLADPEVLADSEQLRTVSKRYNDLGPIVVKIRRFNTRRGDGEAARQMLEGASGEERQMLVDEIDAVASELAALESELRELMIPKDPHDGRDVIVEIRGAEGGEEANLFARDLYEMYSAYASSNRWKTETLSAAVSDMGGYNDITFVVSGETAWRNLKYEGGPHRVQRVPVTESQGRVHTSSATVTVLPDVDDVAVAVDDRDLEVDVYRSSGAGGQHVNTTDSAVRITHVPTGVVVTMQDERSQLQNRNRAMQVLRARLFERAEAERAAELSTERRSQVGGGGRSEKIRTYNFKENRVTDHRIGFTVYRLADILGGHLGIIVDALATEERARLLAEGLTGDDPA